MHSNETAGLGDAWERFAAIVVAEPELFERLRVAPDATTLARLAVEAGRERGCPFSDADVNAALTAARRSWQERRAL